jgi:hypothetical protein
MPVVGGTAPGLGVLYRGMAARSTTVAPWRSRRWRGPHSVKYAPWGTPAAGRTGAAGEPRAPTRSTAR